MLGGMNKDWNLSVAFRSIRQVMRGGALRSIEELAAVAAAPLEKDE